MNFSVFLGANKQVEYSCEKPKWQITRQMSCKKQDQPNSFNVACATPEAKQQPEQLCLPWKVKVPLLVGTNHKDFTQIVIIHQAGYFWKETSHTKLPFPVWSCEVAIIGVVKQSIIWVVGQGYGPRQWIDWFIFFPRPKQ